MHWNRIDTNHFVTRRAIGAAFAEAETCEQTSIFEHGAHGVDSVEVFLPHFSPHLFPNAIPSEPG